MSRFVTGLDKENFKLFEDKVEQEITQFSSEDAPLSVGIVFDTSGSMGAKLQKSRQAVAQFMKTANPEDEFFLIQFNDRPELVVPFTPDTEEIQNRLTFTQAKGRTALLDGVYMAMNQMKKARNPRKAILIISDGGDNSSRYTESEVKNAVREADVQIYAIGIFEPMASRGRTPEEMSGPGPAGARWRSRPAAVISPWIIWRSCRTWPPRSASNCEISTCWATAPRIRTRDGKYRRVQVKLVKTTGLPQLKADVPHGILCADSIDRALLLVAACLRWRINARPAHATPQQPRPGRDPRVHADTQPGGAARQRARQERQAGHEPSANRRSRSTRTASSSRIKIFRREDVPVSMGIIIDNSGSMRDKRAEGGRGVAGPGEGVQSAGRGVHRQFQRRRLSGSALHQRHQEAGRGAGQDRFASGGTAMRDAISMSIDYLKEKGKKDKKVLLVVTDGNDNTSNDNARAAGAQGPAERRADLLASAC